VLFYIDVTGQSVPQLRSDVTSLITSPVGKVALGGAIVQVVSGGVTSTWCERMAHQDNGVAIVPGGEGVGLIARLIARLVAASAQCDCCCQATI